MTWGSEGDVRQEFVDGNYIQLPPASPAHFRLIQRLLRIFWSQLSENEFEIAVSSYGLGMKPGFQACRNPDLAIFRREDLRHARVEGNNVYALPLLIGECLSPRDRKGPLTKLLRDYRRIGAPEVWIMDPHTRVIEKHSFAQGHGPSTAASEGVLCPSLLSGVKVQIQELWDAFDGQW